MKVLSPQINQNDGKSKLKYRTPLLIASIGCIINAIIYKYVSSTHQQSVNLNPKNSGKHLSRFSRFSRYRTSPAKNSFFHKSVDARCQFVFCDGEPASELESFLHLNNLKTWENIANFNATVDDQVPKTGISFIYPLSYSSYRTTASKGIRDLFNKYFTLCVARYNALDTKLIGMQCQNGWGQSTGVYNENSHYAQTRLFMYGVPYWDQPDLMMKIRVLIFDNRIAKNPNITEPVEESVDGMLSQLVHMSENAIDLRRQDWYDGSSYSDDQNMFMTKYNLSGRDYYPSFVVELDLTASKWSMRNADLFERVVTFGQDEKVVSASGPPVIT